MLSICLGNFEIHMSKYSKAIKNIDEKFFDSSLKSNLISCSKLNKLARKINPKHKFVFFIQENNNTKNTTREQFMR